MNTDLEVILGSVFIGAALAVAVLFGREHFVGWVAGVERDLADKLRRLRAPTRHLHRYVVAWLIGIAVSFVGLAFVLSNVAFAILIAVLLVCVPWYLLRRMAERRRLKIEDQLADSMVTLSNAVKAGLSLPQALELLASQLPRPINVEFHQIVAEYKMGKPLERTLTEAKERLRSENFALFVAAMMASHESGGRLNETVERIAKSVLEMQRLDRKVRSETAQARRSAVYMAVAPAFILAAYYFVDPANTQMLFVHPAGQLLLAVAVVLNVVAYLWARMILNPDI
jgi:tight adherence protein B